MLIFRTYGCGSCERTFEELMDRDDPHPNFCKHCGAPFDGDVEPIPGTHSIGGSAIAQGVDGTYRALEESSAARAAELNAPHMKITNMRDNLREGDVAAMPVRNTVTAYIDESKALFGANYGYQGPAATVGEARASVGPANVALAAIQGDSGRTHISQRMMMTAAGQRNKTESS